MWFNVNACNLWHLWISRTYSFFQQGNCQTLSNPSFCVVFIVLKTFLCFVFFKMRLHMVLETSFLLLGKPLQLYSTIHTSFMMVLVSFFFKIYLSCACRGTSVVDSYLLPCRFLGLSQVIQLGSKHFYPTSHGTGLFWQYLYPTSLQWTPPHTVLYTEPFLENRPFKQCLYVQCYTTNHKAHF